MVTIKCPGPEPAFRNVCGGQLQQSAIAGFSECRSLGPSYYVIGLISYLGKGIKDADLLPKPLTPEILTAISVPLVVGFIFFAMRRVHHKLSHKDTDKHRA
jgi:uncharacterized membrane-anchored protein